MTKYIYPIYIICKNCNKTIVVNKAQLINRKFCSKSCNTSYNNKIKIYSNETKTKMSINAKNRVGTLNSNYKGGGILFICHSCKLEFKVPTHAINSKKHSGKFCSKKCCYNFWIDNKLSVSQRRLTKIFSRNISLLIKNNKIQTSSKWFNLIGYSLIDLRVHLESKFKSGMTWKNYGKWHIDHIIPISYFKFDDENDIEFKKCWDLKNLQPLWCKDNLSKGGMNTKINKLKYKIV